MAQLACYFCTALTQGSDDFILPGKGGGDPGGTQTLFVIRFKLPIPVFIPSKFNNGEFLLKIGLHPEKAHQKTTGEALWLCARDLLLLMRQKIFRPV